MMRLEVPELLIGRGSSVRDPRAINYWVLRRRDNGWRDGTSHFLFEPIEFLEKLEALVPRPAVNLLVYHGVLAPRARWRSQGRPLRPRGP
jgi:hypothetical protein